jgi:hypothetical protein
MAHESTVRAMASRMGYAVRKSRERTTHLNNLGEYMLVELNRNFCVLGERYDATLDDIERWLQKQGGA